MTIREISIEAIGISLMVTRLSFVTISLTQFTSYSVLLVEGRPERAASSTEVTPFWNFAKPFG